MNERLFGPLKMKNTGLHVLPAHSSRLAEAFAKDPLTGAANVRTAMKRQRFMAVFFK